MSIEKLLPSDTLKSWRKKINEIIQELGKFSPVNHASDTTEYGTATGNSFGHVKLSNEVNSSLGLSNSTAATPYAVKTVNDKADCAYNLATEAKERSGNSLSILGGTMLGGNIEWKNSKKVISLGFSPYVGGRIKFIPFDYYDNPGGFEVVACDGLKEIKLIGSMDGGLKWNNKDVEIVETINMDEGIVRYSSGIQMLWGTVSAENGSFGTQVFFKQCFKEKPIVITTYCGVPTTVPSSPVIDDTSTTGFTVYANVIDINWLALGRWM